MNNHRTFSIAGKKSLMTILKTCFYDANSVKMMSLINILKLTVGTIHKFVNQVFNVPG